MDRLDDGVVGEGDAEDLGQDQAAGGSREHPCRADGFEDRRHDARHLGRPPLLAQQMARARARRLQGVVRGLEPPEGRGGVRMGALVGVHLFDQLRELRSHGGRRALLPG